MRILLSILVAAFLITPAYAEGGHREWGHDGGRWRHGGDWGGSLILPAIITGAIIYDVTRPRTVYVEPAPTYVPAPGPVVAPVSQPGAYWYYCPASRTYYPYVASCQSGWQTVPATPPAPAQ